jgi:poly-gamma-glutamate synthesis protein (capsule biosynthesis protein)
MFKPWSQFIKYWPWIISIIVILAFLFWPRFNLVESNQSSTISIFSKIKAQLISLPVAETKPALPKVTDNVLIFGGDIMLSRTVNAKIEKYQDYQWPFKRIASLFNEADLAIANLESPFLVTNNYLVPSGSFSFKANPLSVTGLSLAGFDVLSLANNHILNQGRGGLEDTYKILDKAGVSHIGTVEKNLVIKESKGVKFAFLAYTYSDDSSLVSNMLNISKAEADVKQAKEQADVVIVLMHAGTEYKINPNSQQINFAHAVISAGADLVVGTHPHWPQTVENYQGKTIIYSLGNLVFDQMWSKETSVGLVAKIFFKDKKIDKIEYIPIDIKDFGQAEIMPAGLNRDNLLKSIGVLN